MCSFIEHQQSCCVWTWGLGSSVSQSAANMMPASTYTENSGLFVVTGTHRACQRVNAPIRLKTRLWCYSSSGTLDNHIRLQWWREGSGTGSEDGQTCEELVWEKQLQETATGTEQRKLLLWPDLSVLMVLAAVPLHWKLAASISPSCNKL